MGNAAGTAAQIGVGVSAWKNRSQSPQARDSDPAHRAMSLRDELPGTLNGGLADGERHWDGQKMVGRASMDDDYGDVDDDLEMDNISA